MEAGTRTAVLTGAGSGIGASTALELAKAGWTVVLAGRRHAQLQHVAATGAESPGRLDPWPTDITDEGQVKGLFEHVVQAYGRLDLLVNGAGMAPPAREIGSVTVEEWNSAIAVNLTGTFLCTRAAFRVMRNQRPKGGRIINNGSVSASSPRPFSAAYTATKHAITGLTKSTALDGRTHDIVCSQIDIGNAATRMTDQISLGARQPDGSLRPEPVMDVVHVAKAIQLMAELPLDANVAAMTIMASKMPFVGRG